ncbi:MAG: laccase [Bacillales bacterium]|jgi:YfiH family protein|nr:laccase [Bacillales bacterium]
MEIFTIESNYLTLKQFPFNNNSLVIGFSTRKGGFSKGHFNTNNLGLHVEDSYDSVIHNRNEFANNIRFPLSKWVCVDQVHGNNITKINKSHIGKGSIKYSDNVGKYDAMYTFDSNILLTTFYADCVPIYFYVPNKKCIALAHAGWKGTSLGIGINLVNKLNADENILPDEIYAVIGPSIGSCCYEVNKEVIDSINKMFVAPVYQEFYNVIDKNKYKLDLKLANKLLLMQSGIKEENILSTEYCTSCTNDLFYSYRRDKNNTGRMMSFIGFKEE